MHGGLILEGPFFPGKSGMALWRAIYKCISTVVLWPLFTCEIFKYVYKQVVRSCNV